MNLASRILIMMITCCLAACGGGGGGVSEGPQIIPPVTSKTTAVLKIGTQENSPSGALFTGVGITLTLPKGVTVAVDSSNTVAASVVTPSGVAVGRSVYGPIYTPATSTANATLYLIVDAGATLFGIGEFVTVYLKLPAGNSFTSNDFTTAIVTKFEPSGTDLAPVAGISSTLLATLY